MAGASGAVLSNGMMGSAPPERTWPSKYHGRPRAFGCTNPSPRMRSSSTFFQSRNDKKGKCCSTRCSTRFFKLAALLKELRALKFTALAMRPQRHFPCGGCLVSLCFFLFRERTGGGPRGGSDRRRRYAFKGVPGMCGLVRCAVTKYVQWQKEATSLSNAAYASRPAAAPLSCRLPKMVAFGNVRRGGVNAKCDRKLKLGSLSKSPAVTSLCEVMVGWGWVVCRWWRKETTHKKRGGGFFSGDFGPGLFLALFGRFLLFWWLLLGNASAFLCF